MFLRVILEPYAISNVSCPVSTIEPSNRDVTRTKWVLIKVVPNEMCLEERTHLCISRTRVVQDEKVNFEASHVDENGKDDQTEDPCCPVA